MSETPVNYGAKPSMSMIISQPKYQIADNILHNIVDLYSSTKDSFQEICKKAGYDSYLVHCNISLNRELKDKFTRARKLKAQILAEQTIDIADTDNDAPIASNRIKSRQWLASRYDKETYGDNITVDQNVGFKEFQIPVPIKDNK